MGKKGQRKPECGHKPSALERTVSGLCRLCMKDQVLQREYGISLHDYVAIWKSQNGQCAICSKPLKFITGSCRQGVRAELDHDHRLHGRGSVRGILCGGKWAGCNRKLGRLDNIEWLEHAIAYLRDPPAQQLLASLR